MLLYRSFSVVVVKMISKSLLAVFCLTPLFCINTTADSEDLANGWGQDYAWQSSLDTALTQAAQLGK